MIGLDGFESRLPQGALRRHAAARRLRPRAGARTGPAADGRAVLRAGRADRGEPAHRADDPVGGAGSSRPRASASSPTTSRRRCCSPTGSSCSARTPAASAPRCRCTLDRPRDRRSPAFDALVDQLYDLLTGRDSDRAAGRAGSQGHADRQPLPGATVGGLAGLVEIVYAYGGRADLPDIADRAELRDRRPAAAGRRRRRCSACSRRGRRHRSSPTSAEYTTADIQAQQADLRRAGRRTRAAGADHLARALDSSDDGSAARRASSSTCCAAASPPRTRSSSSTLAIDWGRYGELFDYDADDGEITVDPASAEFAGVRDNWD